MTDELPGRPIWLDLATADGEAARAFYGGLFGWTVEETGEEFGGYALFLHDGRPVAGLMADDRGVPSTWTVYLETNDAAETAGMVEPNGGRVVVAPMAVGDLGTMAVVADPAGAVVGVWQPGEHRGLAERGVPGTPAWFEVLSTDYPRAIAFYENVFGWDTHTMSATPEFRYTTLGKDDHALAGLMDGTETLAGEPSRWTAYVAVEDTEAALARVEELGGTVVRPAEDTPHGRLASIADPSGARLSLMGPGRS